MALYRISEAEFRDRITGFDAYTKDQQKIGTVKDILIDEAGHLRYLILETGFWIFGKEILLPIGLFRSAPGESRIYVNLTKQQAEALPAFNDAATVSAGYEEQVRQIYRMAPLESSASLESAGAISDVPLSSDRRQVIAPIAVPIEATAPLETKIQPPVDEPTAALQPAIVPPPIVEPSIEPAPSPYEQEPDLYRLNDQDESVFKLYEERLIASRKRVKAGEVVIGKHTEIRHARVLIPLDRERIVFSKGIASGQTAIPSQQAFQPGEVLRYALYEETANLRKQPVVREQVTVRKETQQEILHTEAQVRREQLDVTPQGFSTSQPPNSIA